MAVSFPSSFVQNYGALFFPIAADYVTTAVFNRVTSQNKAQFAGCAAGGGALYFFGKQTSLAFGLTGAVLYLIYKVISTTKFPTSQQNLTAAMQAASRQWMALETKLVCVSEEALDFSAPDYNAQFRALTQRLEKDQIRAQWESQDFLNKTHVIMVRCRRILFEIHNDLKRQTIGLASNREDRLQKMSELLKDTEGRKVFDAAFLFLNQTYRAVRCQAYMLSLPNSRNYPHGKFSLFVTGDGISLAYCNRFITGEGPQRELNKIFNAVQDELADLLQLIYPGSPLNVKDEQSWPGDYEDATNLFRTNGLWT